MDKLQSENLFEALACLESYKKKIDFLNKNERFITADFTWELFFHSEIFAEQKEYSIALELCQLGIWVSDRIKHDVLKYSFLLEEVKLLFSTDRKDFAYNKLLETKKFCHTLSDNVKGSFLVDTGMIFQEKGYLDDGLNCFTEAKDIFERINDTCGLIAALTDIGVNYCEREELQTAEYYFDRALNMSIKEDENANVLTNVLLGLGYSRDLQGEYPGAREYYSKALSVSHKSQDKLKRAHILYNLAFINKKMKEQDSSFYLYEKCFSILRDLEIAHAESYYFFYRGLILRELDNWDEARYSWVKSLDALEVAGKNINKKTIEFYLGNIDKAKYSSSEKSSRNEFFNTYFYRGKREFSLAPYKEEWTKSTSLIGQSRSDMLIKQIENYKFASPQGEYKVVLSCLKNLANLYLSEGRLKKSLITFREAISLQWKTGDFTNLMSTLEGLGKIYRKLKKEKQSLVFYSEAAHRSMFFQQKGEKVEFDKKESWIYFFLDQPKFAFLLWSNELKEGKPVKMTLANLLRLARLYMSLELYKEAFFFLDNIGKI
ncbi:MAG TPA: tetratricopeptide repeat protein [Candidatus Eremiobacteraeota bacterium]|nr:tetratricopeptide repeat protein [Candidatus Eremiobacteraeota bacterium]